MYTKAPKIEIDDDPLHLVCKVCHGKAKIVGR